MLRLLSGIYEPTRGSATVTGRVAPVFDLGVGMDPEISGFENILIRGMFLGQSRKQMAAKVDEIAEFTELGDYLSMPLRTYSTGMRVRLAMGVVTSIDPEILLLDEGIGAVDAEFLKKARTRLQDLVARSGILVFASHSNEFLARLCKTAMWIDHGTIKMSGGIEDVVRAYEGEDAARHVREVLEEDGRADERSREEHETDERSREEHDTHERTREEHDTHERTREEHEPVAETVCAVVVTHRRVDATGHLAEGGGRPDPCAGPPHRRRQRRRSPRA